MAAKSIGILHLNETTRAQTIENHLSFFRGRQHDHLKATWTGMFRDPGVHYMRERYKPHGFEVYSGYGKIPGSMRKPDVQVPIPMQVVTRFTSLVLGEGAAPSLNCQTDLVTEAYLEAYFDEADMWDVINEARNMAGATGAAPIVMSVVDGKPQGEVLNPAHVWVQKWAKKAGWIPEEVVEQKIVERQVVDGETKKLVTKKFWVSRMWTLTESISYEDIPAEEDDTDEQEAKEVARLEHKAGRCPMVWYQNTRNSGSPHGLPDCDQAWHLFDAIDRLNSMITRATGNNAEPTVWTAEEYRLWRRLSIIHKGAGRTIRLSEKGRVGYLEITGASLEAARNWIKQMKVDALQTCRCVIIDPDTAGAYKSGEALQILWRSMDNQASTLRVPLRTAIREIAAIALSQGKKLKVGNIADEEPSGGILLPPRVIEPDRPEGIGEEEVVESKIEPQKVGSGRWVTLTWPPMHRPTAIQLMSMATAMTTATAAKNVISQQTAVREFAAFLGIENPSEELRKVLQEKAHGEELMNQFFEDDDDKKPGGPNALDDDEKTDGKGEGEGEDSDGDDGDAGGSGGGSDNKE